MKYPISRLRRLRQNEALRKMVREVSVFPDGLVMPCFVCPGKGVKKAINSMPGIFQFSIDNLIKEVKEIKALGIQAIILFGIPEKKDDKASGAYSENGIVQNAVKEIKKKVPGIVVITDVCLCEYMSHGHCGVISEKIQPRNAKTQKKHKNRKIPGNAVQIDNDATVELLAKTALSHADAGADIVAPSAMMDGQVKAIRTILDRNNYALTPIMAYSAKFNSCFYGPFREAAGSPPQFGDRSSYQMDVANSDEAMREIALDIGEGADIVMVKPALSYLDIIWRAKNKFNVPVAAYSVSGEYAMVKAAQKSGWIDGERAAQEIILSIRRAGAGIILTYFAKEIAKKS